MCWRTDEGIHMMEFYMSEAGLVPALALIRLNVIYQYEVELSVSNFTHSSEHTTPSDHFYQARSWTEDSIPLADGWHRRTAPKPTHQ